MKIAVTYENGNIFGHFGHTEQFKIYTVQDNVVTDTTIIHTNEIGHGALARLLSASDVDALICGGIGRGAREVLDYVGIKIYGGVSGNADDAVKALLDGTLSYCSDANCGHHEHSCDGNKHGCDGNCH